MITGITHISLWVKDQDEAKDFYVNKLGFELRSDDATTIPGYRWLTVAPKGQQGIEVTLGVATDASQQAQIGKQGGWVLGSDNIHEDYQRLKSQGVKIHNEPRENPWGTDFVFEDLYGNWFDLVQPPQW